MLYFIVLWLKVIYICLSCLYILDEKETDYEELSHKYCWDQTLVQKTSGSAGFSTLERAKEACNMKSECSKIYACNSGVCGYFLCSDESNESYSSLSSIYRKKNQ